MPSGRYRMPARESRRRRLDPIAEEMRRRNLTHGSGCKSTARAIAQRSEQKQEAKCQCRPIIGFRNKAEGWCKSGCPVHDLTFAQMEEIYGKKRDD